MNDEPRNPRKTKKSCCLISCVFFFVVFIWGFGALARAKRDAQTTACMGNLKMMGIAINMYMQDWDNKLPSVSGFGLELDEHKALWGARGDIFNKRGKSEYIMELLSRYMKNDKQFVCPAVGEDGVWKLPDGDVTIEKTSYIFNAWCVTDTTKTPPAGCMQIAGSNAEKCISPENAPIAWDAISGYSIGKGQPAQIPHQRTKSLILNRPCINVLYMDVHVQSVDIDPNKPPFNATSGRQGHFWGAPDPNKPGGTLGAVGWR